MTATTQEHGMSLVDFARNELKIAGLFDEDSDYGGMLGDAVMKMVAVFSDENHSGASAAMALNIFSRVARFQPLTPLTGEDDEWFKPMDEIDCWQNKRCPHVFKENGVAYDINAVVFREPDGSCYINGKSRKAITFPYTPKVEYVDVPARGD